MRFHDVTKHHVGTRIRDRRRLLGLTQRELAKRVDVNSQQISKYEGGVDDITAGTLYEIATQLGTSVDYFFEGLRYEAVALPPRQQRQLDFIDCLAGVRDKAQLEGFAALVRALSKARRPDAPDQHATARAGAE